MNLSRKLLLTGLVNLVLIGAASAATLIGSTTANVTTDYSVSGAASVDIDFINFNPVSLTFTVDAAEVNAGGFSFNALVRNFIGTNFPVTAFAVTSPGASILTSVGITVGQFATPLVSFNTGSNAGSVFDIDRTVNPDTGEGAEAYIGGPLSGTGINYQIQLNGLAAGDTVSFVVAVPEPSEYAMMLAGLMLIGVVAKKRNVKK